MWEQAFHEWGDLMKVYRRWVWIRGANWPIITMKENNVFFVIKCIHNQFVKSLIYSKLTVKIQKNCMIFFLLVKNYALNSYYTSRFNYIKFFIGQKIMPWIVYEEESKLERKKITIFSLTDKFFTWTGSCNLAFYLTEPRKLDISVKRKNVKNEICSPKYIIRLILPAVVPLSINFKREIRTSVTNWA